MTFGPDHYVPVLKIKRGEKHALRLIAPRLQTRIIPLMEFVERTNKTLAAHLDTAFRDLAESVGPYARCFLDTRELCADGLPAACEAFRRAAADGLRFTPVTGVSRSADLSAALEHRANGLALRISRQELEDGGLTRKVHDVSSRHGLSPEGIDLIIDLGAVDDLVCAGIEAMANAFLREVPDHSRWRTFTISACAFPMSMGVVGRHSHAHVDRIEWITWRDRLHANRAGMPRLPTFSDCGIQHPSGVEGFDPRTMQVSASIRYASSDTWLLIKGQGTRTAPATLQFPNLATQLAYGHLRSHFAGAGHCRGCAAIKAAADRAPRLGSAEVWRRLGTVHHITTVAQDLASLLWP